MNLLTAEETYRLRRTVLIEMQSPDFQARSKMKARRLILEEDSSTESRRAAMRERLVAGSRASGEGSQREGEIDEEEVLHYRRPVNSCRTVAGFKERQVEGDPD